MDLQLIKNLFLPLKLFKFVGKSFKNVYKSSPLRNLRERTLRMHAYKNSTGKERYFHFSGN